MDRKVYCDHLRVLAVFAVIMLNVAVTNWFSTDVNGSEWQTFNFYDGISRWAVPVFVMISGSLFLGRDIPIKTIYQKYVLRIVIAYFVWSAFYAFTTGGVSGSGETIGIMQRIELIAKGHYHMWFLIMIVGIYMCIPIYRLIVSNEMIMKYFLILSFTFACFIPWIIKVTMDFIANDNVLIQKIAGAFDYYVSGLSVNTVLGYSFYFVLGYYLDKKELNKRIRTLIYILGVVGFAATVLFDLILAIRTQQYCSSYYDYFSVNVVFEAVCLHTLFKYHEYRNERFNRLMANISTYCFGAYLLHAFFIELLSIVLGLDSLSFNAAISVPFISVTVFVLAFSVSAVLNHIPIVKKYCV